MEGWAETLLECFLGVFSVLSCICGENMEGVGNGKGGCGRGGDGGGGAGGGCWGGG